VNADEVPGIKKSISGTYSHGIHGTLPLPLLGFLHIATSPVKVDPIDSGRSVRVRERDRALGDVGTSLVVRSGEIGPGDVEGSRKSLRNIA